MRLLAVSLTVSTIFLLVAVVLASLLGSEPVSLARGWADAASVDHAILFEVRLPRIALAGLAGGGLAVVGCAFQALLRNPLAEPYVLGVSGGAAFGATLAIVLGAGWIAGWGPALIPASALLGGLLATVLVYAIAGAGVEPSGTSILLAGVIVNAIAGALITALKSLVSASKAQELLFWLMGFIDVPSPSTLAFVSAYVVAGGLVLMVDAGRMNLLSLGDESARHLGVDVRSLERRVFLACSLVVGAIVSVTGLIGFVGLVIPHALRRLIGPDHRVLLPTSLIAGAGMLVLCDMIARAAFQWIGTEPPVGAVTALVGGPLFLVLLRRRRVG
jgi:iron complex transport system permease protein